MTKALVLAGVVAVALTGGVAAPVGAEAPQPIKHSTTWTKADSPVRIGSIHILGGVTVRVEPGVQVVADEGAVILVSGSLRAEGTEAEPVVFTGSPTWRGIRFVGVQPFTGSTIDGARITGADVGVHVRHVVVPVDNTLFEDNGIALRVENPPADVAFTGNEFYSNGTAFSGKTTGVIGIRHSDFWDNDVSMFFEAQSPYSCATDYGIFDVHDNDILRGPAGEWYSFDVRTSERSANTDMRVLASGNWWGTTDEGSIAARMRPTVECCPGPERTRVQWWEPAVEPQTEPEPPGPVADPPEDDDIHGDPGYITSLRHPGWGDCLPRGSVGRVRGKVHEVFGLPDEIPVAVVKGTTRCKSYDPDAGFVPSPCHDPIEVSVPVRGSDPYVRRFSLELRRPLPPGRYTVYAGDFGPDVTKFRVLPD